MVQTRNYLDFVAVQLAEIATKLDDILSQMKKDVEELKVMFGKPTTNQATPLDSEPEDEDLVEGTIPSSPPFSASAPPSPLAQPPTIASTPPASATPPHISVELPPNHTATYTSPHHTAPSIKSPPSPTITLVLRVPSPVLFTTTPIQRQTPAPRKACLVQPTVAGEKPIKAPTPGSTTTLVAVFFNIVWDPGNNVLEPIKAPTPGSTTTLVAVFFNIVWDPGNNVLVHNNGLAAKFSYTRLEGKSSLEAGSIDTNPTQMLGQTGSGNKV